MQVFPWICEPIKCFGVPQQLVLFQCQVVWWHYRDVGGQLCVNMEVTLSNIKRPKLLPEHIRDVRQEQH